MIRTLAAWGLSAERNPINRGVWAGMEKIGSIGIAVRRGVSFHGFSLNVSNSLEPFEWIHPCGLERIKVTSMERVLSRRVPMREVREVAKHHIGEILNLRLEAATLQDLLRILTGEFQPKRFELRS